MAFPSVWPGDIDSYDPKTDGIDDVMAVNVNELQSAIVAIETMLLAAVDDGDTMYAAGATAKWTRLAHPGSSGHFWESVNNIGSGLNSVKWSAFTITGNAASSLAIISGNTSLEITSGKTLKIQAADNYTVTFPASGTVVLGTGTLYRLACWAGPNTFTTLNAGLNNQVLVGNSLGYPGWSVGTLTFGVATVATIPNLTGTLAMGAATCTAATTNNVTVADHIHAITSVNVTTAAANLLACDAAGGLQLKYLGVGTAYNTVNLPVYTSATYTDIGAGSFYGAFFQANNARTVAGGAYANYVIGLGCLVTYGSNFNSNDLLYGFQGKISNTSANTVYFATGLNAQILNTGAGKFTYARGIDISATANTGSITDFDGLNINATGAITTSRAVHLQSTFAGTTKWGLYFEATGANSWHAGKFGIGALTVFTPAVLLHVHQSDAVTNTVVEAVRIAHNTSGIAAAGFGSAMDWYLQSSTTADQQVGRFSYLWATETHASRKARSIWSVWDTAEREGVRIEASGTAPMLGFYGGAAVGRGAALTAQKTTITHTAPGTPDYAIQDFTQTSPWGFASHDEANTVLSVIANLQVRVAELEARLGSATGVNLFA